MIIVTFAVVVCCSCQEAESSGHLGSCRLAEAAISVSTSISAGSGLLVPVVPVPLSTGHVSAKDV